MPVITVHGAKGGQGTTTVAAVLAILHAHAGHRTLLVDTAGDPAILATNEPDRPGLAEYLNPAHRLAIEHVTTNVTERLDLIARGDGTIEFDTYTYGLLTGGLDHYDTVIIDTATHAPAWDRHADHDILVTRPCYLALRRAVTQPRPAHLAVVTEPGRALNTADIEAALGIPVTVTIALDSDIARCIDAGLLNTRIPRTLTRALRPLLTPTTATATDAVR